MRLLLTAVNCPKGDVTRNLARHLELVDAGRQRGCDLVVLPEMSLTGYSAATPLQVSDRVVAQLVGATAAGPGLCFGFVESVRPEDPVRFITQVIAVDGRVAAVHRKAGLGEDEADLFAAGTAGRGFEVGRVACSVAVCAEIGTHPPYALGSTLVLGPAAPGLHGPRRREDNAWRRGFEWWRGSVLDDAARLLPQRSWLAVSTQAGATVDEDFPGWAALIGAGGIVVDELPDWREGMLVVDVPVARRDVPPRRQA